MPKQFGLFALFLATLLTVWQGASVSAAPATSNVVSMPNGYAYAAYASLPVNSNRTSVGPLLLSWFGCSMSSYNTGASAANLTLGSFASATGTAHTSITNTHTNGSATIQTTAGMNNLNILSGLITATTLQATVASTITPTSATSRVVGVSFIGLTIAGKAITTTPSPNSTINIANLGHVVINEQGGPNNGTDTTYIGINLLDLNVTLSNTFGLPIGTRIVIDQANSGEVRIARLVKLAGQSFGLSSTAQAGSNSTGTGLVSHAQLPCVGGNDQNNLASSSFPGIGSTGAISTTATGQNNTSGTNATTRANIQSVNLLSGLIHGSQISATAAVQWNGTGSGSASTDLTNTFISGLPVAASPKSNTRLNLPGLGYVILNEQTSSFSSTGAIESVNALDIVVTARNIFNLPIGTRIIVGHADATVGSLS